MSKTRALRDDLLLSLQNSGIEELRVDFDGSCDEGQIEGVAALTSRRAGVDLDQPCGVPERQTWLGAPKWDAENKAHIYPQGYRPMTLRELIEEWTYAALEDAQPGWELEDGSFGSIVIRPADGTAQCEFSARYMDIRESTLEL